MGDTEVESKESKKADFPFFDTDYENYDVLYGCFDVMPGFMKYEYLSISSR